MRRTVPDPDSSQRPTEHQEQQAREGFRAMDAQEAALAARVQSVAKGVDVEVDRETVTLRGRVRDAGAIARIEDAVRAIDGVGSVVNRLVVG